MVTADEIRRNLDAVRENLAAAAAVSGRKPDEIALMGVTKFQPAESILAAFERGLGLFGENRIQERESKSAALAGIQAEWHMIGTLQRNKARRALAMFDCIQSVGDITLAETLERIIGENPEETGFATPYPVMVEVNVSGEYTKQGVAPEKCFALIDGIAVKCPRVEIRGLMTIGPLTDDEHKMRDSFRTLRELREEAKKRFDFSMRHLSMGMSADYAAAIMEGSTMIRVGTAIFGARDKRL
ncbi:MAG: YggS family pyridoxal phosphate-dependent enzyme [Synergistaceae bacterium]|jgi:pyridoxal phosphate enzyme (YggS family)|nr:YggS family pyridoxal phosphate-dependent enzyme [Synergistaceae bacterium]